MSYNSEGIWCLVTSSHQTKKAKLFLIPLHSSTGNCMMYAGVMHFRFVFCHYLHLRILSAVISNNIKTSAPLSTAKCVCVCVCVRTRSNGGGNSLTCSCSFTTNDNTSKSSCLMLSYCTTALRSYSIPRVHGAV